MPIALVTGASAGIGQAAAHAVVAQGTGVVLTYRGRAAKATETVAQIEAAVEAPSRCSAASA